MGHEFAPSQFTLRQLTPADAEQALDVIELVFLAKPLSEEERAVLTEEMQLDGDRAIGVFDDLGRGVRGNGSPGKRIGGPGPVQSARPP